MNKTETKKISRTAKDLITQARLIGSDIQSFESQMTNLILKVKEINKTLGRQEAVKMIPFIREMGYNHGIKTLDAESINSKIMTIVKLSKELGVELGLSEDDYEFIESISFKSWLHTVVVDGELKISESSKFEKVVEEASLTHSFEPDEDTLDKILNSTINAESR